MTPAFTFRRCRLGRVAPDRHPLGRVLALIRRMAGPPEPPPTAKPAAPDDGWQANHDRLIAEDRARRAAADAVVPAGANLAEPAPNAARGLTVSPPARPEPSQPASNVIPLPLKNEPGEQVDGWSLSPVERWLRDHQRHGLSDD